MPTTKTCQSTSESVRGPDRCRRYEGHRGKHRGRYTQWTQTREERAASAPRRYVPPHRRVAGDAAPLAARRRYQRPPGNCAPMDEDAGDTPEMEDWS